mmetsp:Transcript_18742/g.30815  ORF Transcript_18742/g.30815 Transcript_18742/m.30815 type:complete len:340 (-) Transcript_18742:702-1721(-)
MDLSVVKRKADENDGAIIKRQRVEGQLIPAGVKRTSSLEAPIMLLTGHGGEIFTLRFSPNGKVLASGSFDKCIFLWNVQSECKNFSVLKGHSSAVLELKWSTDGSTIFSASADKTVGVWDPEIGRRIKKLTDHGSYVNSCCPARRGPPVLVSGSDDNTARTWDLRVRGCTQTLAHKYPVTSVCFNDPASHVITGSLDNEIKVWDLRKNEVVLRLQGHADTITSVRLSPDGSYLLSNSMDNTVRIWDLRPYAPPQRCLKVFQGLHHTFEKNLLKCNWSADGTKVTAGSGDRFVYVWDTATRRVLFKLPGHAGCVNEVDFHPTEPIIGSAGSDKQIFLGEI